MASARQKGWRWDRDNDRLDFYYEGARIGHIDADGIDLASGMDFEIDGASASGGGTGDLLADGSVPLSANWDVGAFTVTALKFTSDQATGTAPFTVASTTQVTNLNASTLESNAASYFAVASHAMATHSDEDSYSISTSGTLATGNATITGDLTVTGAHTFSSTVTVDELILDTDGVAPAATNCYAVRDNSGDLTVNAITSKTFNVAIANNDEYTFSATALDLNANSLLLDTDGNTYLDNATDNTIKMYIAGAQDFTFSANNFLALDGSTIGLGDGCHLQFGVTHDGVITHSAAVNANTAVTGLYIGTPVVVATVANSLVMANVTQDADIIVAVNDGGHSQSLIWCDGSAGEITLNSTTSGTGHLAIANTDEYTWDASNFIIASGNDLKFAGNDGIVDSAGAELIQFTATGSAINYLQVINAATADPITLQCLGTEDKGFVFETVGDEEILALSCTASAVAYLDVLSAADTGNVKVATLTSGTNAGLKFDTAGTGQIVLALGTVETLNIHDAASIAFAAENDTAGHPLYMQTEDGGGSAATAGAAGGLWNLQTGDGSAAGGSGDDIGGAGGAYSLVTGAGAAGSPTNGAGGAGGAFSITSGIGGAGDGTGTSGAGGAIGLTGGAGTQCTDNAANVAGAGGTLTLTGGAGGTSQASGTGGAGGSIVMTPGAKGAGAGAAGAIGYARVSSGYNLQVGNAGAWSTAPGTNCIEMLAGTQADGTATNTLSMVCTNSGDDLTVEHADGTSTELLD